MEAFKVVEKGTRYGTNWALFRNKYMREAGVEAETSLKFKKDHPDLFPRYFKGSTVRAKRKTPGLFCFTNRDAAYNFLNSYPTLRMVAKVIKVKGSYPVKHATSRSLIRWCGGIPARLQKLLDNPGDFTNTHECGIKPQGCICFRKVKVLE